MKTRILIGILIGIVAKELISTLLPSTWVYIDVWAGAFIAAIIGRRVILGLAIAIYSIMWKLLGLFNLANFYGYQAISKQRGSFSIDFAEVLVFGLIGGWLEAEAGKWHRKEKSSQFKPTPSSPSRRRL